MGDKDTIPFVEAGMKALKQQQAVDNFLGQIINDAVKDGELNIAAQIGMFVVYMQQLEQTLKRIIGLTYSYKSHFDNNGYSIHYDTQAITRKNDPLGLLVKVLKLIRIRDEKSKEYIMDEFCTKLDAFAVKRNDYIHRLINSEQIHDLETFKGAVIQANQELLQLIQEADEKLSIIYKIYELDGLPYTFARHIISSEKYGPKPKLSKDK